MSSRFDSSKEDPRYDLSFLGHSQRVDPAHTSVDIISYNIDQTMYPPRPLVIYMKDEEIQTDVFPIQKTIIKTTFEDIDEERDIHSIIEIEEEEHSSDSEGS